MKIARSLGHISFLIGMLCNFVIAQEIAADDEKEYGDPQRFEKQILAFEEMDEQAAPPKGAIVGIGISSMRGWHDTIKEDLAPLTIIPRGFGGSNMNDALHYAERMVVAYQPRAVVVYEGDNDIAQGIAPAKIAETFRAFVAKVHAALPECRVYFLAIKPSIKRWQMWPQMVEANGLIAAECAKDDKLTYVDVATGMLASTGTPRAEIFKEDNLHMNRAGYVIWRDALRPILHSGELQYESAENK